MRCNKNCMLFGCFAGRSLALTRGRKFLCSARQPMLLHVLHTNAKSCASNTGREENKSIKCSLAVCALLNFLMTKLKGMKISSCRGSKTLIALSVQRKSENDLLSYSSEIIFLLDDYAFYGALIVIADGSYSLHEVIFVILI